MGEALLFGLAASSSLEIGGVLGAYWRAPTWLTGIALAFASGALSALAFELFEEAFETGGPVRAGLGLLAGSAAFVLVTPRSTGTLRARARISAM